MSTATRTDIPAPAHDEHRDRPTPPAAAAPSGAPAWWVVTCREVRVKARDRGFLVSTLLTLGLIVGMIAFNMYMSQREEKVTVAYSGQVAEQIVQAGNTLAEEADENVRFDGHTVASDAQVREAVRSGNADVGLVPAGQGWKLIARTANERDNARMVQSAIQQTVIVGNAARAGVSLEQLNAGAVNEVEVLDASATPKMVTYGATFAFGFLLYLVSVLLGSALATGIVEEKQNRIVEVIAGSVKVRDLLVGKVLGITIMAMAQMLLFAGAALAGLWFAGETEMLRQVGPAIGWFLPFFVVGVAVLAGIFAAAGSLCTRAEDIQSATTPVTMLAALAFIAGISVHGAPARILGYVPLVSTIVMPGQVVAGEVSWWAPMVSLLIAVVFAIGMMWLSDRIYRAALLQVGRRTSWREALRGQA